MQGPTVPELLDLRLTSEHPGLEPNVDRTGSLQKRLPECIRSPVYISTNSRDFVYYESLSLRFVTIFEPTVLSNINK